MKLGVPPVGANLSAWAGDLRRWLERSWDSLTFKAPGAGATQDGVFLWDASGPYPVVARGGVWVPVLLSDASGWGAYVHTGATQVLAAGVKVTMDNNAGSVIETQKPSDIATFYDGSVITGREGDGVAIGVELTFTPSSGAASLITVAIDIGGAVGELYVQEYTILHGSGVAHKVAYVANAYQLDTWEANGGLVKVVADGPGDVTLVRYVIQRLHKALP